MHFLRFFERTVAGFHSWGEGEEGLVQFNVSVAFDGVNSLALLYKIMSLCVSVGI